jgi:non-specific serine/threonine protein kinase/serine/threonine-protein kinase
MPHREQIVDELFARAVGLEPAERQKFFAACAPGGEHLDTELVAEVEALLKDYSRAEAARFLHTALFSAGITEPTPTLAAGQEIEGYKILRFIAEGGMGEVYLAEDTALQRQVALKLIKSNLKSKEVLRRFINERQILANLEHPNIARLLSAGATGDGQPFFVMEYVAGQPLDQYSTARKLPLTDRLKLFRTICAAVSYAHQHLVIHRDIKPSNILVTEDGTPKLLDFGISKLLDPTQTTETPAITATVARVMTPEYASPEQVRGDPVTTATDIYSLGVLLYELLVGHRPYRFQSSSPDEIARVICTVEPERPSTASARAAEVSATNDAQPDIATLEQLRRRLRGDLDNIILKALRKEPARRYASVSEFSEDIRRHLEGLPVRACKDTFTYRASKFVRRNKLAVAAAAIVSLTLVGGIIATAWEARVARAERARAEQRFNDVRRMANSFMFELNDEIEKGPTKAREMLVKKALEYLDNLAQEGSSDPSLQVELATAYQKIGDIQGNALYANLADTSGALNSYEKALKLGELLAATGYATPASRKNLADTHERIADILWSKDDLRGSLEHFRRAAELEEALSAAGPQNVTMRLDLATLYQKIGNVRGYPNGPNMGDTAGALQDNLKALAIRDALSQADPANKEARRALYISHFKLATLFMEQDDFQGAREHALKMLQLAEAASAANPTNAKARRELAIAYNKVSSVEDGAGNLTSALQQNDKALAIYESLTATDPKNAQARRDLWVVYLKRGELLVKTGDATRALEVHRKALALIEALVAADPTNAEAQGDLAESYNTIGETFNRHGDAIKSLEYLRHAAKILQDLLSKNPTDAASLSQLALCQLRISTVMAKSGDLSGALDNARQAIVQGEKHLASDPKNRSALRVLADSNAQSGKCYVLLAAKTATPPDSRIGYWRQARDAYQRSLTIWQEMQTQGALSSADAGKPDEVSREIAKCNRALGK